MLVNSTSGQLSKSSRHVLWLAVTAAVISFGFFFLDGSVEPNLADEGYLWHGMTALKAGQVPLRDFHSYDPGRYCWLVAWSYLLGDGLVSMRASCVLFQCAGVLCGLLALRRLSKDWGFLLIAGVVLVLWMVPFYKAFEQAAGLMAIYAGVRLIENPSRRNFFLSGIFIGLMAFLGRNHGVYQLSAFGLITTLISWGEWKLFFHRLMLGGLGIIVGYLPQLLMIAFIPGFYNALIISIASIFKHGTNLSVQVPWPWRIISDASLINKLSAFVMGIIYMGLIAFVLFAILQVFRMGRKRVIKNAVFLASVSVGVCYIHFTFSRPDWVHLAHSVPLCMVGVLALCSTFKPDVSSRRPITVLCGFLIVSLLSVFLVRDCVAEAFAPEGRYVEASVKNQNMSTSLYKVALLRVAKQMADYTEADESLMFLPHIPGLYPAVGRLCPTYQSYYIIPMSHEEEETVIEDLKRKKVKWVLLQDVALDERQDYRFRYTNPLLHAYFEKNYEVAGNYPDMGKALVLRLKQ